jgi:hypothetical protein
VPQVAQTGGSRPWSRRYSTYRHMRVSEDSYLIVQAGRNYYCGYLGCLAVALEAPSSRLKPPPSGMWGCWRSVYIICDMVMRILARWVHDDTHNITYHWGYTLTCMCII